MDRPLRTVLAALALCAALAPAARAQDPQPIAAEDFRRLDPDRADGRRYSIAYMKYLKLFRGELKLYGGVNEDSKTVFHPLAGRLQVEDATLTARLSRNTDSFGRPLVFKRSNIHVIGRARKTPRGLMLMVEEVRLLDSQLDRFTRLSEKLPPLTSDDAAKRRAALVEQIKQTVDGYPEDQEAVAPLIARLDDEARQAEYGRLERAPLPGGAAAHLAVGARYRDIALVGRVLDHPEVSDAERAKAREVLEQLGARLYRGRWLAFPEFQRALGFGQRADGEWLPQERLALEAAAEREKERLRGVGAQLQVAPQLLVDASRTGEVIRGMSKQLVVAACNKALGADGAYPVRIETYEEVLDGQERSWELWVMKNGLQIFFLSEHVVEKADPAEQAPPPSPSEEAPPPSEGEGPPEGEQ